MSFYFVFVFRICLFCLENKTDTQILTAINEKIHEENQVFSLLILVYYKEILYDDHEFNLLRNEPSIL